MSGVVFEVKPESAHRDENGRPVYFCCEKCAMYFTENRDRVTAVRNLSR